MYAAFGSIGSALAVALFTPILAAHPYELVASPPGSKPVVSVIPQVYTNNAFSEGYLLIGGGCALIILILALVLQAGRTPAKGGIIEEAVFGVAAVAEAPVGEASLAEALATELAQTEAPANESTVILAPASEANGAEAPSSEPATQEIKRPDATSTEA